VRISRLYCPQSLTAQATVALESESAHYVGTVLRMRAGEHLTLFNGEDGEFSAVILHADRKGVTVQISSAVECAADPRLPIHLALGISRGERMDYAIQKATEAGATFITPLFTERCEVKIKGDRVDNRLKHWERVAISACEQSGRCRIPVVSAPVELSSWLQQERTGASFVLDHRGSAGFPQQSPPEAVTLLIGPEGGLSEAEISTALVAGFQSVRLGPRVLRTETAPVVAIAVLQQLWGDYSSFQA